MTKLICIVCPRGCHLEVDENLNVTGNSCKRGLEYGKSELTNPTRMITSTVMLENSLIARLPVMTDKPIPKNKIFEVMNEINKVKTKCPVKIHDIIIENVLGLGVNIIATRTIEG